jgi:beta-N-acetylhexosaminidase
VVNSIIRERIGFDGLLMTDDLGMQALSGDFGTRAAGAIAAGCDIALHCSGDIAEMEAVAAAVPALSAEGEARLSRAMAVTLNEEDDVDFAEAVAKRDALLALV